jgi:hypothetical protein
MDETVNTDTKNKPADAFTIEKINDSDSEHKDTIVADSLYYDEKEGQIGQLDQSSNDDHKISKVLSILIFQCRCAIRVVYKNVDFSFENGSIYLSLPCKDS